MHYITVCYLMYYRTIYVPYILSGSAINRQPRQCSNFVVRSPLGHTACASASRTLLRHSAPCASACLGLEPICDHGVAFGVSRPFVGQLMTRSSASPGAGVATHHTRSVHMRTTGPQCSNFKPQPLLRNRPTKSCILMHSGKFAFDSPVLVVLSVALWKWFQSVPRAQGPSASQGRGSTARPRVEGSLHRPGSRVHCAGLGRGSTAQAWVEGPLRRPWVEGPLHGPGSRVHCAGLSRGSTVRARVKGSLHGPGLRVHCVGLGRGSTARAWVEGPLHGPGSRVHCAGPGSRVHCAGLGRGFTAQAWVKGSLRGPGLRVHCAGLGRGFTAQPRV